MVFFGNVRSSLVSINDIGSRVDDRTAAGEDEPPYACLLTRFHDSNGSVDIDIVSVLLTRLEVTCSSQKHRLGTSLSQYGSQGFDRGEIAPNPGPMIRRKALSSG